MLSTSLGGTCSNDSTGLLHACFWENALPNAHKRRWGTSRRNSFVFERWCWLPMSCAFRYISSHCLLSIHFCWLQLIKQSREGKSGLWLWSDRVNILISRLLRIESHIWTLIDGVGVLGGHAPPNQMYATNGILNMDKIHTLNIFNVS